MPRKLTLCGTLTRRRSLITGISDSIWRYTEVRLREEKSAKCLADVG